MIYEVRAGDSPAKIAIQYAGCPKCAIDLVLANPHKPSVTYPNGFRTFQSLRAGERLRLPDKWFNGTLDAMPPSYFAALPHPSGVSGSLGQPSASVVAAAHGAIAAINGDPGYCTSVGQPGSTVNTAVHNFKAAWNAGNPSNPVPINTGKYESPTAAALSQALGGSAPAACDAPLPVEQPAQASAVSMRPGTMLGIAVLSTAATLFGVAYLTERVKGGRQRGRRRR